MYESNRTSTDEESIKLRLAMCLTNDVLVPRKILAPSGYRASARFGPGVCTRQSNFVRTYHDRNNELHCGDSFLHLSTVFLAVRLPTRTLSQESGSGVLSCMDGEVDIDGNALILCNLSSAALALGIYDCGCNDGTSF